MNQPDEPAREVCPEDPWRPRYLTVTEAAEALSRHRSAVLRLIHTGQLRSIRLGRSYRIRETEVRRHLTETGLHTDDMLDVAACARILRCSERTIHALVKLGHLASENGDGDACHVAVTEFRRFLRDSER